MISLDFDFLTKIVSLSASHPEKILYFFKSSTPFCGIHQCENCC